MRRRPRKACLQKDERILFTVGDLDERLTLQQAIDITRDNRQHISWARLPSILLLPQTLAAHEAELQVSGVLAHCLVKPVQIDALVQYIRRARSR